MLKFYIFALTLIVVSCKPESKQEVQEMKVVSNLKTVLYSNTIRDSFYLSISLPAGYSQDSSKKYPVLYLLDANLYFDIFSTIIRKYSEVGLAPDAILVGIGYKDFQSMDSLRQRDYTYPTANKEYEMPVSGGADKFLSFMRNELLPEIQSLFRTDTSKQVVLGHSLGGYLVSYACLKQIADKRNDFSGFIAASPSFHYNNYWLPGVIGKTTIEKIGQSQAKLFVGFGALEDAQAAGDSSVRKLQPMLSDINTLLGKSGGINMKFEIYSNLDHMDTQIPTFLKGLQWLFDDK